MNVVAVLQARTGSTRLPNKVLMPLAGKPMVQNIIERVMRAKQVHTVVLAAPLADRDTFLPFKELCPGLQVYFHPGDPNDLVDRHYLAAAGYGEIIVRVPCDNPVADPAYIDAAVQEYLDGLHVFYTNTTAPARDGTLLDGVGCEVFSFNRLQWLDRITRGNPVYREHPHKCFYDMLHVAETPGFRLDVNTQEDYDFINAIYSHFGHNRFTTEEVLASPPVQSRVYAEAR